MLNSKQRAALRGAANGLSPVFQVGKGGIEDALAASVQDCLAKRELVKLRLLETCPTPPRDAADALAQSTGAEVVQVIGRVIVLFKMKKKESAFEELLKQKR